MTALSKPVNTLALAPGKREFGVAVFTGIDLTYFSLKSLRDMSSEGVLMNETAILIRQLIDNFEPRVIAVKAISQYQLTSSALKLITQVLKHEAEISKIPLIEISLTEIKSMLCNNEKATKEEAFRSLGNIYPELIHFMNRPNKWQNEYYNNLFTAVSVGVVVSEISKSLT